MAETVHLHLKVNGAVVRGDSSQTSLGRDGSIECVHYEQKVGTARDAGTGQATGRRQYEPLVIRKRIDRASPLLFKALTENQKIEGVFQFFRPNPSGDGTTEQFYTVTIKDGRIASVRDFLPDSLALAGSNESALEEVTIVFTAISWVYTNGGVSFEDRLNLR